MVTLGRRVTPDRHTSSDIAGASERTSLNFFLLLFFFVSRVTMKRCPDSGAVVPKYTTHRNFHMLYLCVQASFLQPYRGTEHCPELENAPALVLCLSKRMQVSVDRPIDVLRHGTPVLRFVFSDVQDPLNWLIWTYPLASDARARDLLR